MSVFSREEVVGKVVIDAKGYSVGKVVDIGISATGIGILKVETKEGDVKDIPMNKVQAIGEFIILKPEIPRPPTTPPPTYPQPAPPKPSPFSSLFGQKQQQPQPPPGYIICPRCRYPNPPGSKFCQNCGNPLT